MSVRLRPSKTYVLARVMKVSKSVLEKSWAYVAMDCVVIRAGGSPSAFGSFRSSEL